MSSSSMLHFTDANEVTQDKYWLIYPNASIGDITGIKPKQNTFYIYYGIHWM